MSLLVVLLIVIAIGIAIAAFHRFRWQRAKAQAAWLSREIVRTDSRIEVVEIWSDEQLERHDRALASAILEKVGADLLTDASTEATRLRSFLVKIRQTGVDSEADTPRDIALTWFACLQLQDQDPGLGLRLIRSLPLAHPFRLRLCRSIPIGSIPAGNVYLAETASVGQKSDPNRNKDDQIVLAHRVAVLLKASNSIERDIARLRIARSRVLAGCFQQWECKRKLQTRSLLAHSSDHRLSSQFRLAPAALSSKIVTASA
jgi:hypothetical protein